MRWNQPAEYMFNILTLGELSVATLARVHSVVQPLVGACGAFELNLEKFSGLPNMIQPRFAVLHFSGEGVEAAAAISRHLDTATQQLLPHRDARPFQPNMVLGRIKTESEQLRVALGRALKMTEHPPLGTWRIDNLELLISHATSDGMGYKVVETLPLRQM
ncbi:MAG TPA: hypothetical protein VK171_06305 [Fimbriimonas sp.]|nr:hypothetical protein [Fimbriimonas sp.]